MFNQKVVVLALAAILSSASLQVMAANSAGGSTADDGSSQTREPAQPATNADPDASSLPQGADGGKTDNGPVPAGSKPAAGGQTGSSSGGSKGGG
ncbi:hypothetical protein ACQKP5_17735 [Pseudomonas vancouverensis]|uniref:hypothetical protein n=1 Tax=Pseudomonas vancouverensis TaxID=95300 RepID=UPI003D0189AC